MRLNHLRKYDSFLLSSKYIFANLCNLIINNISTLIDRWTNSELIPFLNWESYICTFLFILPRSQINWILKMFPKSFFLVTRWWSFWLILFLSYFLHTTYLYAIKCSLFFFFSLNNTHHYKIWFLNSKHAFFLHRTSYLMILKWVI